MTTHARSCLALRLLPLAFALALASCTVTRSRTDLTLSRGTTYTGNNVTVTADRVEVYGYAQPIPPEVQQVKVTVDVHDGSGRAMIKFDNERATRLVVEKGLATPAK